MQVFFGVIAYCLTSFVMDCCGSRYLLVDVRAPLMQSKGASRTLGNTGDNLKARIGNINIELGDITDNSGGAGGNGGSGGNGGAGGNGGNGGDGDNNNDENNNN